MKSEAKNVNISFTIEGIQKKNYGKIATLSYSEAISQIFKAKAILYLPKEHEIDVTTLNNKNISLEIQIRENNETDFTSRRFISGTITTINILDYHKQGENTLQKNQTFLERMRQTTLWKLGVFALTNTVPGMGFAKTLTEAVLDKNIAGAYTGMAPSIVEQYACNYFCYEITIEPKLYLLNVTQKLNRVFYKPAGINFIDDVIKVILDKSKIKADFSSIKDKDKMHAKSCVQYNETDLEFIERIMSSCNLYYYFTHEKDQNIMVISNSSFLDNCQKIKHGKEVKSKFTDYFNQISISYKSVFVQNPSYTTANEPNHFEETDPQIKVSHNLEVNSNINNQLGQIEEYHNIEDTKNFSEILVAKEGSSPGVIAGGMIALDGDAFIKYKNKNYLVYQNIMDISETKYITYEDAQLRDEITELKKLEKDSENSEEDKNTTHLEKLLDLDEQSKLSLNQEVIGIKKGSLCTPYKILGLRNALITEHPAIVCDELEQDCDKSDGASKKCYLYVKLLVWDSEHSVVKAFFDPLQTFFTSLKPGDNVNIRFVQRNGSEDIAVISNQIPFE